MSEEKNYSIKSNSNNTTLNLSKKNILPLYRNLYNSIFCKLGHISSTAYF